ncbi:glycosyltransferase [Pseudorhodoferax sp. Leaf265]|uniref:glycosyltransferase n=1 Tax=Pseudorhodoferax sp. Leaf265 TaxID=1736315 RepID=UPI0006F29D74|nr:glycosyltransferase [Pseudorhodoferax sp. Leaf265]KQP14444.1 glycosyl transferase family 1 [Pseudorhodoferax sp. Leaf265]
MKVLFVHQNFPGQFKHLAPRLVQLGHEVVALGVNKSPPLAGVRHIYHAPIPPPVGADGRTALDDYAAKFARGESAAKAMRDLSRNGFQPDVVFAHPGWGESIFARDVFPRARHLMYAEYYYGGPTGDAVFDPEFASPDEESTRMRTRLKNMHLLQAMEASDGGLSPTKFQRDQHPDWFRDRISVIHDGIDTDRFRPNPAAVVGLRSAGVELRSGDEVVTFVARELEPYRGYHTFMRSLPSLLAARPNARVVIVGGDGVSYGAAAPAGKTWKQIFLDEVRGAIDQTRVHFVGRIPHEVLTQLMQVSAVHVYLTYPFVLSWSLLEAMSIGCLVVGSRTAPLEEVIQHGRNGLLVDFFDPKALADTVAEALENRSGLHHLRASARESVVADFDLKRKCLPTLVDFVGA